MKLSVCMATYNGSQFLRKQLDSILLQLPEDAEIVISDDSSSDDTLKIIESYKDSRIVLLKNQQFQSPIFNLENALNRSSGDVLVLADQDDVWLPNKISVIHKHLEQDPGEIFLVMMNGDLIDANDKILSGSMFQRRNARKGILHNLKKNSYMGCNMAFTRALLDRALPFPKTIPMHDSWLGLLAEVYGRVLFVDERTMQYRLHDANASIFASTLVQKVLWRWCLASNLLLRILKGWFNA